MIVSVRVITHWFCLIGPSAEVVVEMGGLIGHEEEMSQDVARIFLRVDVEHSAGSQEAV